MNLEQFIDKYKPLNISVDYNKYKNYYQNIKDYIEYDAYDYDEEDFIDKEEILKTGNLYELYVYPDTPIGFYKIFSSRLDLAINKMSEVFEELINEGRYKIEED